MFIFEPSFPKPTPVKLKKYILDKNTVLSYKKDDHNHHCKAQLKRWNFHVRVGAYSLQTNDLFFKFCGDCSAGRSGEEGSRDNNSVFQSPWSITLTSTLCSLRAFFKKSEYKEGKFHQEMSNKFQGKSLTLTEHSLSVFVTVTVSNVVRF